MRLSFRNGFYAGLSLAVVIAVWLWQLWQPTRQVELHSEHLIAAVQSKNWDALGRFLDDGYRDQWNQDRPLVLSRLREVLRFARNLRLTSSSPVVIATHGEGDWNARITIDAASNEIADLVKSRVNHLDAPFELHWQQESWRPWDWKLVRVSNTALDLSDAGY
ncbi:MAG: hypothetical protein ACXWAV_01475 [Chthoniobacterales bacterium]